MGEFMNAACHCHPKKQKSVGSVSPADSADDHGLSANMKPKLAGRVHSAVITARWHVSCIPSFQVIEYLEELKKAVQQRHDRQAEHVQSVPVKEVFEGKTVWAGSVEIFTLRNAKAKRCYAWGQRKEGGGWEITTVLEIPPVISPHTAVKAVLAAKNERRVS
jgi:hypothetical protein